MPRVQGPSRAVRCYFLLILLPCIVSFYRRTFVVTGHCTHSTHVHTLGAKSTHNQGSHENQASGLSRTPRILEPTPHLQGIHVLYMLGLLHLVNHAESLAQARPRQALLNECLSAE